MISVVIPSYNRRECIMALLRDLFRQENVSFEVIVVDDASPDGSAEAVAKEFPQVNLLINEQNGGPCVSRNRGILAAQGEVIVGLDSDVSIPDTGFLAGVVEIFANNPASDGFCFRLLMPDGETEDTPRWWHPVSINTFANRKFETFYFSGTAYAFRKSQLVKAGMFPVIYYMDYEEVELAWRILDGQGRILHCPDLKVIHHANPVSRRSEIKVFYKPRNQILLALRTMPLLRGITFLVPRMAWAAGTAIKGGHFHRLMSAWISAARLTPRCLRERKKISKSTWKYMQSLKKQ